MSDWQPIETAYDDASFREGFRARLAGKTIHENPHATFTYKHSNWQDGWTAQDEHLSARNEALDSIGWFGRPSLGRAG